MSFNSDVLTNVGVSAGAMAKSCGPDMSITFKQRYNVVCRNSQGEIKWVDHVDNLVTTVGLNFNIDTVFGGSSYTAAFSVGLTDGTPTFAAGDTAASHSGWVEVTAYDEASRPALTLAAASSGSASNSGSTANFTISTNGTTIGGAFIITNNTKGGTTGTLYGGGAFSAGDKVLDDGDTLAVTVNVTAASA